MNCIVFLEEFTYIFIYYNNILMQYYARYRYLREPLSIPIKYKTIDNPKIDNILKIYLSTFRRNYSHHQEMNDHVISGTIFVPLSHLFMLMLLHIKSYTLKCRKPS